jgi:hypothetical protein
MRHKFHCTVCGKRTRVVSSGNADMSEWKKSSKGKWAKIKKPSRYRLVLKCGNLACRKTYEFRGASKAKVMHTVRSGAMKEPQ